MLNFNKIVVVDIETIANKDMIPLLPEPKPAANLKDPVKIQADIAVKLEKQVQEMGLSPSTSRICCLGWKSAQKSGTITLIKEDDGSAAELLSAAWDVLSRFDHFVTFNGRAFDIPTINFHSIRHSVRIPVSIDVSRYNRAGANHIDLRPVLAGEDRFATGKLDFFVRSILGREPAGKADGMDGGLVQHFWDMGLIEDIAMYCAGDCVDTWDLFERCVQVGVI